MTFLYPFALLGLIAIPILIIIYIIRNRYKETTAPTTYIWEVAAKLLKKRNPFHRFEHLLALIVQILAITILSLALAHPVFTLKEAADDIVFVLDASASMGMTDNGMSRFEKGKKLIAEKAEGAASGSTFTLILSEKEPRIVCSKVDDMTRFQMYLDSVSTTDESSRLSDAIASAQVLFSQNEANLCYLATDQRCGELANISLLDCSDELPNYAVTELTYELSAKKLLFAGTLISYTEDADLKVEILVNDEHFGDYTYSVIAGEPFAFTTESVAYTGEISSVTLNIQNEDGMPVDNTYTVYANDTSKMTKVLVVSSSSTYLRSIFSAMKNVDLRVISPSAYRDNEGYDLYVFDCYSPAVLPTSGAVMMIGLTRDVVGSGFSRMSAQTPVGDGTLQFANNDSLLYTQLTRDVLGNRDMVVASYQHYSLTSDFTTVLTCDNVPVLFAGRNESGQREVVFAFDLHDSNLPVLFDYVAFMRNFVDYANPTLMTEFDYGIGDSAVFSVPDDVVSLTVDLPNGKSEPVRYNGEESLEYELTQIGSYALNANFADGSVKTFRFYSRSDFNESNPRPEAEGAYALTLNEKTVRADGLWDNILPIVIAAAVFFAGDWILYAHEQY